MEKCNGIMVVEDDREIRQLLVDLFTIKGHQVLTAVDGKDALRKLEAHAQTPCFILCDLFMPNVDGWEFLELQKRTPNIMSIPVIAMSSAYENSATAGLPKGTRYVKKPFELDNLVELAHRFCVDHSPRLEQLSDQKH